MTTTFANRFWRVGRSIAKWIVIIFAILTILIILGCWEEDWRGARDWAAYKNELQAKGEILDLRQLVPSGNPEDDLSKVPIFAEVYKQPPIPFDGTLASLNRPPSRLSQINLTLGSGNYNYPREDDYRNRMPTDMAAWQKFYRGLPEAHLSGPPETPAQDVLEALGQFESGINETESAVDKSNAFWPSDWRTEYDRINVLTDFQRVADVLRLRAVAHLGNNQSEEAKKDFLLLLQLTHPNEYGGDRVDYLVGASIQEFSYPILWEGIHRHEWNESELENLELATADANPLESAVKTLRCDRAMTLDMMVYFQNHGPNAVPDNPWYKNNWYDLHRRPNGWWDQDRKLYCSVVQEQIDSIHLDEGRLLKLNRNASGQSSFERIYTPFAAQAERSTSLFDEQIVEAETNQRLARLACRLEEYWLAHQQYPDSLSELPNLPLHLNEQVLTGEPLHYQHSGDTYLLYSPSWDGKDRGGVGRKSGQINDDYDWIWPGP